MAPPVFQNGHGPENFGFFFSKRAQKTGFGARSAPKILAKRAQKTGFRPISGNLLREFQMTGQIGQKKRAQKTGFSGPENPQTGL